MRSRKPRGHVKEKNTVPVILSNKFVKRDTRDAFDLIAADRGLTKSQAFVECLELYVRTAPGDGFLSAPPFDRISSYILGEFKEKCHALKITPERGLEDALITYIRNFAFTDVAAYRKKMQVGLKKSESNENNESK